MKNKPCPFCDFVKQTEFFYHDRWKNIIICRDLRDLSFKYRLLAVRTGVRNHKTLPTGEERSDLMVPLIAVIQAHIKNGKAAGYDIDEQSRSVLGHYHYHANLKG